MRKYISPGAWFSVEYPDAWREFEDTEDCFLFYNPDKWTGNFRISAYRGGMKDYAYRCLEGELQTTPGARRVKVGTWDCVYSKENFQENNVWYTSHFWLTGQAEVSVECSFTTMKGESPRPGEEIVRSLRVRAQGERWPKEVIPVRVLEINAINEAYDWAVSTIKKQLTKDFTAVEADIDSIQRVMDSGKFPSSQRSAWESFGFAFGAILVNEMDGMEWVTVIDGDREYAALRFADTPVMVCPAALVWDKVGKGKSCSLRAEYEHIRQEVESTL